MQSFRDRRQTSHDPRAADVIPPEQAVRVAGRALRARPSDVIDVTFETIVESAAPRRPAFSVGNDNARVPDAFGARPGDMAAAFLAGGAVRRAEGRLRGMSAWVFTAVVGICGALTFALALTSASAPKAAAPAARAPLAITTQGHMVEDRGGLKVLTVYGSIENTTAVPLAMPGVQVEVLSGGRRVVLGEVPPGSDLIAPGEARAFSARLPHAGGKVSGLALSVAPQGVAAR
ncbi:hypothetical protein [Rhizobium sp. SG2393]|uniref:hypothetical protein n=1 Tax=Rhizobium sp. SG2393 TaxID=3276279 RepID=UPI003672B25D